MALARTGRATRVVTPINTYPLKASLLHNSKGSGRVMIINLTLIFYSFNVGQKR